jgi:hypothetical protein
VTLRARWVTLRARWVTLRARWVTLRARWVMLRVRWVTLRARWVTLRARWVTLRAFWVTLRARWVTLRARWVTLKGAEAPSIFLFNLGPLAPIVIFHMHQANPQNLYIDVDGVLDALLSGRNRHEASHYTGLPSETSKLYDARQVCSQTSWSREGDCVAPKSVPRSLDLKPGLSDLCFQKGAHGKPLKGRVSYFPDHKKDGASLNGGYFPRTVGQLSRTQGSGGRKAGPSIGQQIAG